PGGAGGGVIRGLPGRPPRVLPVRHVDVEGDAPDDEGRERAAVPGSEPLGRERRFGRAGGERGGFRHELREPCPAMGMVSTGSAIGSGHFESLTCCLTGGVGCLCSLIRPRTAPTSAPLSGA